jgi:adenylate cyclase
VKSDLSELSSCLQGIIPALIATCDAEGEPNVTYLSHVQYVDAEHVALSCQFFNKTKRNVSENPYATVIFYDPVTFEAWRMELRYDHEETGGPLFDSMALRIEVIASHTGMTGVFKLRSSDVYEVLSLDRVEGFLLPPDPELDRKLPASISGGPRTELRGVQVVSERIARARDLDGMLASTLHALDELLGFSHSMLLVVDEALGKLVTIASRGYGADGIGAEVAFGEGVIGTVAERRRMVRISGVGSELRYGRAIRGRVEESGSASPLAPEIPLPGLCDAQVQLALPLLVGERLIGVLAVESRDPLQFDEWDEAYLQILGNQIALGIDRMQLADDDEPPATRRQFVYYRNDDCVFVDGEYLIRNIPAKILWKVLSARASGEQREFTNRELRLDPALGLPALKDNLESRLILLRKRLEEKCSDVRLVPVRRGRFAVELDCQVELIEKDSA